MDMMVQAFVNRFKLETWGKPANSTVQVVLDRQYQERYEWQRSCMKLPLKSSPGFREKLAERGINPPS